MVAPYYYKLLSKLYDNEIDFNKESFTQFTMVHTPTSFFAKAKQSPVWVKEMMITLFLTKKYH